MTCGHEKEAHDIFIGVNFLFNKWEAKYLTIGLFEVTNTIGVVMHLALYEFFDRFFLTYEILAYIKDERFNLKTCARALNLIIFYISLVMLKPFDQVCFGHVLSKACQYATLDNKVAQD